MSTTGDLVALRYLDLVRQAYLLEKGERKAELEGRRLPMRDGAGVHPFSYIVGKYDECFTLLVLELELNPGPASEVLLPRPRDVRQAARADAETEWIEAWLEARAQERARECPAGGEHTLGPDGDCAECGAPRPAGAADELRIAAAEWERARG